MNETEKRDEKEKEERKRKKGRIENESDSRWKRRVCARTRTCLSKGLEEPWKRSKRAAIEMTESDLEYRRRRRDATQRDATRRRRCCLFPVRYPPPPPTSRILVHFHSPRSAPGAARRLTTASRRRFSWRCRAVGLRKARSLDARFVGAQLAHAAHHTCHTTTRYVLRVETRVCFSDELAFACAAEAFYNFLVLDRKN